METLPEPLVYGASESRAPTRGAWIETAMLPTRQRASPAVAPPRGARGLKLSGAAAALSEPAVAPPRGARGLKQRISWPARSAAGSRAHAGREIGRASRR